MTPEIEQAVEEIRATFEGHALEVKEETQGGAYVIVAALELGSAFSPAESWVGFLITFQYPRADVYPHFVDPYLHRKDGAPLGVGFSGPIDWNGRKAIQISRKSNRLDPASDTAALKLQKVLEWVRKQ